MGRSPSSSVRQGGRRNIAIACENCRARKVRCDGCRPVCRTCVRRNFTCEYTVSLGPWDRSRQKYVQDLERKLRDRGDGETSTPDHAPPQHHSPLDHNWQGNPPSSADAPPEAGPSQLSGSVHVGLSSTGVFLRQLHQAAATTPTSAAPASFTLGDLGTHTSLLEIKSGHYNLPPLATAQDLQAIYWRVYHPVYPAIDRSTFQSQIDSVYNGTVLPADRRMIHCTANFIFAMAEKSMMLPKDQQEQPGDNYFATAKHLLQFDMFGSFSFSLLQALVLSAQYLQSTEKPRQCWAIVGFAISIARSMGLHLTEAVQNLRPEAERGLAVTVWNCLVTLDRTLSMTLGRIPTLSLSSARASTAALGDIHGSLQLGHDLDTAHSFFICSCRLFDILHDILTYLYSEGPEVASAADIISHSSRLEKDLDAWARDLPAALHSTSKTEFATFLRQRYLQVRIILMRPGLVSFIKGASTSTGSAWDLERASAWYCANQSIDLATEMADLAASTSSSGATPWWYQLQYCYNAGVTLMAARLSDGLNGGPSTDKIDRGIANCASTIEACSLLSPTAARCLAMFLAVSRRLGQVAPPAEGQGTTQTECSVTATSGDLDFGQIFPWGDAWTPMCFDETSLTMEQGGGLWEDLFCSV